MKITHWMLLLLTAALFGSSFFFIKIAVAEVPPLSLATVRSLIAAAAAYALMRALGQRLPNNPAEWPPLFVLGLLTAAIPYSAIAWGQGHIESSLGGILFATIPVFTVLAAPLFLKEETYGVWRLFGVAVGFAGVTLIVGPQALAGLGNQVLGTVMTLAGAFSYAMGGIYARRNPQLHPVTMTAGQLITASLVLAVLSLSFESPWILRPSPEAMAALAAMAVLSTTIPAFLLFWLIANAGATNASLLAFFMPVSAILLGVLALGERLPVQAFAGLGLIILGAAAVTGRLKPARPSDKAAQAVSEQEPPLTPEK